MVIILSPFYSSYPIPSVSVPAVPPSSRSVRRSKICAEPTEADVIRSVTDYLKAVGALVIRNNTGAMRWGAGGGRMMRFGSKGSPDLIALCWSLPTLFIECKRPGAKLSEDQERWHMDALKRGHRVIVASSVEDVMRDIREAKIHQGRT